jgi:SAM-dependent methyltransferase
LNDNKEKSHWDSKYAEGLPSLREPDPFFIFAYQQFVEPLFPKAGMALDLACGLGRHALWLANRNWQVCGVDLSEVAIRELNHAPLKLNVRLDLIGGDASDYKFEPPRFDLIVLFYHNDRSLFTQLVSALNPGGLLICKLSLRWETAARLTTVTTDPLNKNELPSLFPDFDALYHWERPVRDRGVAEFVGRKGSAVDVR